MGAWFTRRGRRFHADGPSQARALTGRGWTMETGQGKPLDELTVPELRKHADREDIDLQGATLKADLLSAITAHETGDVGLTIDHGLHGPVAEDTLAAAVADETPGTPSSTP